MFQGNAWKGENCSYEECLALLRDGGRIVQGLSNLDYFKTCIPPLWRINQKTEADAETWVMIKTGVK